MIDIVTGALLSGLDAVIGYLAAHTVTCLVPAFFIAGAIAAFVKKEAILKYFSPQARKSVSYGIASVSGTVLAVCSCTILPMFAGILKKGSGIGPATTFLYAGPAINILAVIYTASVLGFDIGLARVVFAIILAILIGLVMSALFGSHDRAAQTGGPMEAGGGGDQRPWWVTLSFFGALVLILVIGASPLDFTLRLGIVYLLTIILALLLVYQFDREEVTDWGYETWDLVWKIFPVLIAGTFLVGVIAYFLPPETFILLFGDNSLFACFMGAIIGAILYMPTLLEVPIIGGTFGYTGGIMGSGPALALLLAGPTISLPSVLVLLRVMGTRKTAVYVALVVIFSTAAGLIFGNIVPAFGLPCGGAS